GRGVQQGWDRRAPPLLPGGLVGELHRLDRVRVEDSRSRRSVSVARAWHLPVARLREPARPVHTAGHGARGVIFSGAPSGATRKRGVWGEAERVPQLNSRPQSILVEALA